MKQKKSKGTLPPPPKNRDQKIPNARMKRLSTISSRLHLRKSHPPQWDIKGVTLNQMSLQEARAAVLRRAHLVKVWRDAFLTHKAANDDWGTPEKQQA